MKLSTKFSFMAFLIIAGLVACGPIYKTFYSYSPPPSSSGRMCANQCIGAKTYCEQDCHARQVDCEYRADVDSQVEFEGYARAQRHDNRAVKKTKSDFKRYCNEEDKCAASCTNNYNSCYTNCGGQVTQSQQCTTFCK